MWSSSSALVSTEGCVWVEGVWGDFFCWVNNRQDVCGSKLTPVTYLSWTCCGHPTVVVLTPAWLGLPIGSKSVLDWVLNWGIRAGLISYSGMSYSYLKSGIKWLVLWAVRCRCQGCVRAYPIRYPSTSTRHSFNGRVKALEMLKQGYESSKILLAYRSRNDLCLGWSAYWKIHLRFASCFADPLHDRSTCDRSGRPERALALDVKILFGFENSCRSAGMQTNNVSKQWL